MGNQLTEAERQRAEEATRTGKPVPISTTDDEERFQGGYGRPGNGGYGSPGEF